MTRRVLPTPDPVPARAVPSAAFLAAMEAIRRVEREWPIWDDAAMREALASRSDEQVRALGDTLESLTDAQWAALSGWFSVPIVGDGWPTIDDFGLCQRVAWAARLAAERATR